MPVEATHYGGHAGSIAALAASDGCAQHPLIGRVTAAGVAGRDLADAVHALCAVHGRISAVFEEAAQRAPARTRDWLSTTAIAFDGERAYLARLTATVGPLPSTPGQRESDAAFAAQRHAFDMLVRSDRAGCATGAVLALGIDWHAFRSILDAAARRGGTAVAPLTLPDAAEIAAVAAASAGSAAMQRALAFGAQQTFAQHRGLCDLIDARASARDLL